MKRSINRWVAVFAGLSLLLLAGALVYRVTQDQAASAQTDVPATLFSQQSAVEMITRLQDQVRANPQNSAAYAQLGWAFLQRVRETGDAALYAQAESAFGAALKLDAHELDALTGMGSLALSRHQFAEAITWGEKARGIAPYRAQVYGIIGDGQTELGRYDEAVATLQKMVDTRPDLNSFSRVSYQRELHGDVPGAIDAMQRAIAAGNPQSEGTLWTQVQLGNLYFNSGKTDQALLIYQQALHIKPDYVYALAAVARVRAAQGKYDEAIGLYRSIIDRLPMPEFIIALGDVYEVSGQPAAAKQQHDLLRAIQQLYSSAGVDVDMELALFDADHGGDPAKVAAQARAAYSRRPTVYAADALAWALYQAGDAAAARDYSRLSLKLGTRDALLHYHAAMIAYKLGDRAEAQQHLQSALAINPQFSIRYSAQARTLLAELTHSGS
jgi:tetratricopeptide (TPR) repeat protein